MSGRIRLVQLIDDLGGGGAQSQMVELVRSLDRGAFDVSACALSTEKTAFLDKLRASGVEVTLIPQAGKVDRAAFRALLAYLRERRPDVLQTWLFTADAYGRIAALAARVPIRISSVRSIEDDKKAAYVWLDRLLARATERFIVNAGAVGRRLVEREWVPPAHVVTIYNGVDTERLGRRPERTPRAEPWGFSADHVVIGYVGRLKQEKRPDLFLEAAARLAARHPRTRFVIVGEGGLRELVGRRIEEMGLGGVLRLERFTPRVEEVLHAIDLLVSPSDYEGCSNVILEAMAAGRPVIATDVGGNRELVVEGETGWLVPAGDAGALVGAVEAAIADPARLAAAGTAGQRRAVAEFSLRRMVERHEELYRSLAGPGV